MRRLDARTALEPDPAGAQPRSGRLLVDRMEGLHHGPPRCAGGDRRDVHPSGSRRGDAGRTTTGHATRYGRLGWFCFDTSSPLSEGSWPAALVLGRHRVVGCRSGPGRRAGRLLAVPPARASCHPFCVRRVLPVEQRGDRRAGVDRRRCAARDRARCRRPPRQRNAADLLSTRRRAVRQHPHGPRPELPWFVGRAHERGEGAGAGANLNLPIAPRNDGRSLP